MDLGVSRVPGLYITHVRATSLRAGGSYDESMTVGNRDGGFDAAGSLVRLERANRHRAGSRVKVWSRTIGRPR